jgi:mannose-6-phosphate isomerase
LKIGEAWFESDRPLPLLIKLLFTTEKLSVQVHPDDAYAARHHNSPGKTEMWHVLRAEPGARIAAGLREPLTRDRVAAAARSGEIENLLNWYDARPGDTFFLPAGTIHAIGPGLVLCEVQQQSDITYRLYDYGRPRELHLDHALEVSHLGPCDTRARPREGEPLVWCDYFAARLLTTDQPIQYEPAPDRAEFLINLDGPAECWFAPPDTSPFPLGSSHWMVVSTPLSRVDSMLAG